MNRIMAILLTFGLLLLPVHRLAEAMPVPSASQPPVQEETRAGGYYGYYYEGDPLLLFLETVLYVGLCVTALIILDEHTDNVTIIVQD